MRKLNFFVYGTLKTGEANHGLFGESILEAAPAWTWGRLHGLPQGYPALELPETAILASGSKDARRDAIFQANLARRIRPCRNLPSRPDGNWNRVLGEWIRIQDDPKVLASLDALEGFTGDLLDSYYRRSLILIARENRPVPAWAYHMSVVEGDATLIRSGLWESR